MGRAHLTAVAVTLALGLALAGCGDSDDEAGDPSTASTDGAAGTQDAAGPSASEPASGGDTGGGTTGDDGAPTGTDGENQDDGATGTSAENGTDEGDQCRITTTNGTYEGSCLFESAGPNGSFTLEVGDGERLIDNVTVLTVSIDETGLADVRGLTTDGVNSRWGVAERSSADPACWAGPDFEVCAY